MREPLFLDNVTQQFNGESLGKRIPKGTVVLGLF